jgi:cytochrome c peroxidase
MAVTSRLPGILLVAALALLVPARGDAHVLPIPGPLSSVAAPVGGIGIPGPRAPIRDLEAAVVLGKALFWDEAVGSDGMACASCHFHAGADARVRNAVGPGRLHPGASGSTFEPLVSGAAGRPNRELGLDDFPLLVHANPADRGSAITFSIDDVISSAGTFGGDYSGQTSGTNVDSCTGAEDPIFSHRDVRTRRVEPRNTPTVINAVFSHRQFADGRASNLFNGVNGAGERDRKARIFFQGADGVARRSRTYFSNASLASQAVMPPLDDHEMSCSGRSFPDLARKLLDMQPLAGQEVHAEDSVLGSLRGASGLGLDTTYRSLVEMAFNPAYYQATRGRFGKAPDGTPYTQIEANFAFFFGLAIHAYEATLVSDQAPFDTSRRDANGLPYDLSAEALSGLDLFMGKAHCSDCHKGSEFTSASVTEIAPDSLPSAASRPRHAGHNVSGTPLVDRIALASGRIALVDRGFANTGVTAYSHDMGIGRADDRGRPLSFAAQYAAMLQGEKPADFMTLRQVSACDFTFPFSRDFLSKSLKNGAITPDCAGPSVARVPNQSVARLEASKSQGGRLHVAAAGVFKIPTLRNVELTGPYMHNGGMATLAQVLEFYSRGGNYDEIVNWDLHPFVSQLALSAQERSDLEAFLRTLTDERVRWERAPFDHPSLRIPDGHVEVDGELEITPLPGRTAPLGTDAYLDLPAIGRDGRTPEQGPLLSFEERLAP